MINAATVLARRTERGLSQRQLAKHAGVSYMTISRMENGADTSHLPLSVLGRLAEALVLEPADLLVSRRAAFDSSIVGPTKSDVGSLNEAPLDHNSARLLRKIHRGDDIRRTMSRADRELTLPALINSGLVTVDTLGVRLSGDTSRGLSSRPAECAPLPSASVPDDLVPSPA